MGYGVYLSGKPGYGPIAEGFSIIGITCDAPSVADPGRHVIGASDDVDPWALVLSSSITIESSDAADTMLGTGARTVNVFGLDADKELVISETVVLDGTTPVALANTYSRILSMFVITAGSANWNVGRIFLKDGAQEIYNIEVANSRSLLSAYTVPLSWKGGVLVTRVWLLDATDAANFSYRACVRIRRHGSNVWRKALCIAHSSKVGGTPEYRPEAPDFVPAGADISLEFEETLGGREAQGGFDVIRVIDQQFPRLTDPINP